MSSLEFESNHKSNPNSEQAQNLNLIPSNDVIENSEPTNSKVTTIESIDMAIALRKKLLTMY